MSRPDFNLLVTLDVLLAEGSVARAAKRLRLSPSAMSRALARLRETTGDPLLVRAGRGLVPTPRALELSQQVGQLVEDVDKVLRPHERLDLTRLTRTFTILSSEGFVDNFGPALLTHVEAQAPGVRLRFLQKSDREEAPLRDGTIDLETGVVKSTTSPELRTQALFRDRYIGVVRRGHRLSRGRVTTARYVSGRHIGIIRQTMDRGPVDEALKLMDLERDLVSSVSGFSAALALARGSDLIATVPERHTGILRADMHSFRIPFPVPEFLVSLLWHPRLDADLAHRWMRDCLRSVCLGKLPHA